MKGDDSMPSNNSKYTEEFREQTVKHIFETGKSATSMAEEMGIDTNTVCRWVRDYRRKHNMPSYAEEKGIRKKEKIYRRKYSTIEEVRKDIYWDIEMFYNRKRRHSSLEYMTPIAYRQRYDEMKAA